MTPTQRKAAEQALEAYSLRDYDMGKYMEALRAALAEQPAEQEPVAMAYYALTIIADSGYESTTEGRCTAGQYSAAIEALHNTAPQPQPPQQTSEWVGLSDDDLRELFTQHRAFSRLEKFARIIEAKLRKKNGGTK